MPSTEDTYSVSNTSSVEGGGDSVRLSFIGDDDEHLLLCIPHNLLATFSTKPRKWLCYAAYAICGATGTLFHYDENGESVSSDLEGDVGPSDHFVYHLEDEPRFVDWDARGPKKSSATVTSRSKTAPAELREYYGGCPFTTVPADLCQCCHLIPHAKGSTYLNAVLQSRSDPAGIVDIDDPRNLITMDARLHICFDNYKSVAFLRTPNEFLKSNEVPGRESEVPDKYLIIVHSFKPKYSAILPHGVSSDMTRGSGLDRVSPPGGQPEFDIVPNGTLLDIAYAVALLTQWGSETLKPLLDDNAKGYYPGGEIKRGEDREGDMRRGEEERRVREQHNRERDNRAARRAGNPVPTSGGVRHTGGKELSERENAAYETVLLLSYLSRRTTPELAKAKREEQIRKLKREEAKRIELWQKEVAEDSLEDTP